MNSCSTCLYQNNGFCTVYHVGIKGCDDYAQNISYNEMVELQEYRKLGTLKECWEALERVTPKKVKDGKILRNFNGKPYCKVGNCANCGAYIKASNQDYCHACGQRIDWRLEDE